MNWLVERYERERHEDDVRRAQQEAEIQALLNPDGKKIKGKTKKVRRGVGSKMVEWGERLQETSNLSQASASKI